MPHVNGMNWIRLHKRMGIYFRDGFDCTYCRGVFPLCTKGYGLTLDHLHSGSNDASNLVTACHECNTSRHDDSLATWFTTLTKRGFLVATVRRRIARQTAKPLPPRAHQLWLAQQRRPNYSHL